MLNILADEGLNGNIVVALREQNHRVKWILEDAPAIKDYEVIEIAKAGRQILITEDKDFGEWVFSHGIRELMIIFLRYEKTDYETVLKYLIRYLEEYNVERDAHEFVTVNKNKIRRRKI